MAKQRKNSLAPITEDKVVENQPQQQPQTNGEITEDSNLDAYITKSEVSTVDYSEKDVEIEVLNEKIESLEKQNKEYIEDNKILLNKIEELSKSTGKEEIQKLQNEIDKLNSLNKSLKDKSDSLLLRNSELEFEVNKLTNSLKYVQAQIDANLHTYTKPGYTAPGGYRQSKDGYQDWI
jgi:DNA repair ATPase RecN